MEISWHVRNLIRRLSGRPSIDEEIFNQLMKIRLDVEEGLSSDDPMYSLLNDYSLDSIVVSKSDGSVIMGNGGSKIESIKGSTLFEYIKSEIPDASYIMVKTKNGMRVIYTDGDYIYIARARGYVSPLEMRLLAKRFRSGVHAR